MDGSISVNELKAYKQEVEESKNVIEAKHFKFTKEVDAKVADYRKELISEIDSARDTELSVVNTRVEILDSLIQKATGQPLE